MKPEALNGGTPRASTPNFIAEMEKMQAKPSRCVVIHGHFYQPPRENPWLEAIEKQPSAGPWHDWNEHVAWECYIPNSFARVMDGEGRIFDLVNNYAFISFNFGPTLLSWLRKTFPEEYRRLIEADHESMARNNGHGNAIAQVYNHVIMPLANPRDRVTQVRWGIADFMFHFGRRPEAMWLAETACNREILDLLIDHGMKYAILAPSQAAMARHFDGRWIDAGRGDIETRRAYRWFSKASDGKPARDRFIDLFFYDGGLSTAIAFERLMSDSKACAERLAGRFSTSAGRPELVSVATDGESYGHHQHFADMCLAHLVKYELPGRGVRVTNYGNFLEISPPGWEVEIKAGPAGEGTAWSCSHGVGRWKEDCGCGAEGGFHQKWRRPLREALNWLRDELAETFLSAGGRMFSDPWAARDAYIEVVNDRSDANVARFLEKHMRMRPGPRNRVQALKLLEIQRHSMLMFTSCGWFFSSLSGIETVQNLKYAARAIQLNRDLTGKDLEGSFAELLAQAPSNKPEYGDGRGVWEKVVKPSIVTSNHILGQNAIKLLFHERETVHSIHHYNTKIKDLRRNTISTIRTVVGRAEIESGVTKERWDKLFFGIALSDQALRAYIKPFMDGEELKSLTNRTMNLTADEILSGIYELTNPFFGDRYFTLRDLFIDEREKIFSLIFNEKLQKIKADYMVHFDEYFPMIREMTELGLPVPEYLKTEVEISLSHWITEMLMRQDGAHDESALEQIAAVVRKAGSIGIKVDTSLADNLMEENIRRIISRLDPEFTSENLVRLRSLIKLAIDAGFGKWKYRTETRLFDLLEGKVASVFAGAGTPDQEELAIAAEFLDLCRMMRINVEKIERRISVSAFNRGADEV